MSENLPLVTVNILSFNRIDELRHTLTKVYEQDYKNIEVIVVDNASSDGSPEMVEKEFPSVILIKLDKNIGIAGWNKGFEIAKGEYVLVLDDDSYPEKDATNKSITYFKKNIDVDIIAANIFNNRLKTYETNYFNENPLFFVGCGAYIRKNIINSIGYFNELIFIYLHELDYCLRVYNNNNRIVLLREVVIYHDQDLNRIYWKNNDPYRSSFRFYHYFISYSIILIQRFSYQSMVKYLTKWFFNRLIVAIRFNFLKEFFLALLFLTLNIRKITLNREVVSIQTQQFYNHGNIPLFDKDFGKPI
ncbi:MAG TPA: glycosyltransferase [Ignavibacteriaceae bacterium]|nr:glycosyltransferase [Ignavibacteriaceae bacterium]